MIALKLRIRRRANGNIDAGYYRDRALVLRNQHRCSLMRGAGATTWALVAGAVLMVAVVALAPRNFVTTATASGGAPVAIAAKTR